MRYLFQILISFLSCKGVLVLMASNTIGKSGKVYAMAAMMPFAMVPEDDTLLLSYALANKNVNSSYHMTASNNYDVYTGLMNGDPYTSQEQKQRDLYEINDTDWHSVSFKGVYSSSVCHLAMHQDWITSHGYAVDTIVNMNLPEQGISGPFRITSIKHILPQKKPESDPGEGYEWKPVTGLFEHQSNDVWNLTFDDGTALGVTNNHPIFSISKGDWQHAGHLEIGEEVLAKGGNTRVVSKERDFTLQPVYNLEVKDLHNFLVGVNGVVVHNTGNCLKELYDAFKHIIGNKGLKHIFQGEINSVGKASGVHHFSAIQEGTARLVGSKIPVGPPNSGIYKAVVEVKNDAGQWIKKVDANGNDQYSTFYPDNWDKLKVMEEIEHAANNRVGNFIENSATKQSYIGHTSDGKEILISRHPQYNNNILTAFFNYD